jgi:predicted aspartyl protease
MPVASDSGVGHFPVPLEISSLHDPRVEQVAAMVDTGSTYTWIPAPILARLGVEPEEQRTFVLADGTEVEYGVAWVRARIGEQRHPTIVVFGEAASRPRLGVVTLEIFGLGVDPVNRRLVPAPGLLMTLSG